MSTRKEPLLSHPIPTVPWSRISMDLDQTSYVFMVDHFSDVWELDQVEDTTASTIIACGKSHFSRHGIPNRVLIDNGPQIASSELVEFSREWKFQHLTSSPYHSQSNGKIEAAVKIAKKLLKRATRENEDPLKAILDWHNTPTESMGTCPVQLLMARRTTNSQQSTEADNSH